MMRYEILRMRMLTLCGVLLLCVSAPVLAEVVTVDPSVLQRLRAQGRPLFYHPVFRLERISVINMIPLEQSDETWQDSEPNLAVDPRNTTRMVGSAFTLNPTGGTTLAPVFVSTDSGNTWALRNIVPSGNGMTGDISLDFAAKNHALYAGILRGNSWLRQMILRSLDPFAGSTMTVLTDHSSNEFDQPYVSATTATVSGSDRDRVYVGFNRYDAGTTFGGTGRTASAEYSLNARNAAPPAGFTTEVLETRNTNRQDMPAVRFAVHNSGVVYGIFYRWVSGNIPNADCDVVVVRDDSYATGTNPYSDLTDPSDGLAGRLVVTNRRVPAFPANLGQNRLVASNLSIAVNPADADEVYIAWADRVGTNDYTLHVRRSQDSGATWSDDLLTITNATNPALAVNSSGVVGFLYQQLTGSGTNQRWETHMRRRVTDSNWSDLILADTPNNFPADTFQPYIGDYVDLIAIGRNFYGVFSAANTPDLNNFPQGVQYQRNANFTTQQLRNVDDNANVDVSIDPFFFKITVPTVVDICDIHPKLCHIVEMEPNRFRIDVLDREFVRVKDFIPKNCTVKWQCPGCEGLALCPPYYHMFFEDVDPRTWSIQVYDKFGALVHQKVTPMKNGLILSFRPDKQHFKEGSIGDYYLGIESTREVNKGSYTFNIRLEVSEYPISQHMKWRSTFKGKHQMKGE